MFPSFLPSQLFGDPLTLNVGSRMIGGLYREMDKTYLLSLINPAISAIFCATFFFLWQSKKERSYVINLSLAFGFSALGSLVDFARVFVDFQAALTFVANIFYVLFTVYIVRGCMIRYSRIPEDHHLILVSAATVAISVWFTFLEPSVLLRGITVGGGCVIMYMMAVLHIHRNEDRDQIDRFLASVVLMTAVLLVLRIIGALVFEGSLTSETQMAGSFWLTSFKVMAIFAWVSLAVSFLIRIAMDLMRELADLSVTDALSGVLNRRGFFESAAPALDQASAALPATILIFDIDRFKVINDTYGHGTGDRVIQRLAKLLSDTVGEGATVGRLGGEEFGVVLPRTNTRSALLFAEGVRTAYGQEKHDGIPSSRSPTVSIGLAETCGGEAMDVVLERADEALYRAKRSGRDRVEIADRGDGRSTVITAA